MGLGSLGMAFGAAHHNGFGRVRNRSAGDLAAQGRCSHGFFRGHHRVTAFFPVLHDSGMICAVAIQALLSGAADDRSVFTEAGKWSHEPVECTEYQR